MRGNFRAAIRRFSTMRSWARRRRELYRDAQEMLGKIVAEKWLMARGVIGLWPANSIGDDVEIYSSEQAAGKPQAKEDRKSVATLRFLRQQVDKPADRPDFCLADFIAPKTSGVDGLGRRLRSNRRHRHR